ncbi:DUF4145 domain-containing protein [Priestia megaterium]|uniref:DUF4145 domain-containing protein n=1 Tax=Priestia megaterium TaxID=1404 RepID=UPI002E21875B|nr:DUF4145 domain-containing protein [Priestia megaterium]
MPKIITPSHYKTDFNCPRCGVLAPQKWYGLKKPQPYNGELEIHEVNISRLPRYAPLSVGIRVEKIIVPWRLDISVCQHCVEYSVWDNGNLVYPFENELPSAHEDMPSEVKTIYNEATLVFKHSPRASAALLRLAIETMIPLLDDYEIKRDNLNTMISKLVAKGIPEYIQQSLDTIRIYGNEGIHPGEIVLLDDQDTVSFMFELINDMVEELITRKKKIKETYSKIPLSKIQAIFKRDNKVKK